MQSRNSTTNAALPLDESHRGSTLVSIFAALALGALVLLVALLLPPALVLPALSTLLVAAGFALATISYVRGSRIQHRNPSGYAVAGALVFLGFAAALLADSDQSLALLEALDTHGLAALSR